MKKPLGFLALFTALTVLAGIALAESVPVDAEHFPDGGFRAYVSEYIDGDKDGMLDDGERDAVLSINVCYKEIASLAGIACFPCLRTLECNNNQLTALDVSGNPALTWLDCGTNQLAALDVSANPALEWLACSRNRLTALDVSANPALRRLYCNANQLTRLDVGGNAALLELYCNTNQLAGLDVSACAVLQRLECSDNQLNRVDVSGNPALIGLWCGQNHLTSVDVSGNPALLALECGGNQWDVIAANGSYDLSALPGFDATRASQWNGGAAAGAILTVPASGDVTYTYDCGNGYSETFLLKVTVPDEPELLPGDVNSDGIVDGRDLLRLAKYIVGNSIEIDEKAADVNRDGKVDGRDVLRLAKQLAGM